MMNMALDVASKWKHIQLLKVQYVKTWDTTLTLQFVAEKKKACFLALEGQQPFMFKT